MNLRTARFRPALAPGWHVASLAVVIAAGILARGTGMPTLKPAHPRPTGVERVLPGPLDTVYAGTENLMYSYGPSLSERRKMIQANTATANIIVTYSGFSAPAEAAFEAAVDIWENVISSPLPIRIDARFTPLEPPGVLGQAFPTATCQTSQGVPNTYYAAALADKLNGSASCAASKDASSEVEAAFNSSRSDWDFGTSTDPVAGKYSFMSVVLHELAHGLGFYGSMYAGSETGSFLGSFSSTPDIFDRFAVTGSGAALLNFANSSPTLGAQLVSDDTFFNGATAVWNGYGAPPKLDTHYFSNADNGFSDGSSYSHVDDALYSGRPNGLMTWRIDKGEVYTDPGPIVRGVFSDIGWGSSSQFSQQGSKLVGTGAVGNNGQGWSVSLSGDGNTAIVGGVGSTDPGAAWVWTRTGGAWTQQGAKLVGSGAVGPLRQFQSVAISADGNTAITGGGNDNSSTGAAWVWTRSAGVWTQQGPKLVGSGAAGPATQGGSVSLSADGNTAIIGGGNDGGAAGAAWVWTRSGGVWTQQGPKLVGSGAVGAAQQGGSVFLSADGNTAIIGGLGDKAQTGAAWVWTRSGGIWTQQGTKLVGSGSVGAAAQGWSVSLSAEGNTAIIGGAFDNSFAGAAWVWTRSGGIWTQQGTKLVGPGAVGNATQGVAVSISADGNTAIVGGVADNGTLGAVWTWRLNEAVWTQHGTKLIGAGAAGSAQQGRSVFLSSDGTTAIVGGNADNGNAGAAWVFTEASDGLAIPAQPTGLTTTTVSEARVDLGWTVVAGTASYRIERQAAGGGFSQIGTSTTSNFSDTTALANSAYQYRVRAVNAAGESSGSAADLATAIVFEDRSLTPGIAVKAVHLSQLRTAVNAVRFLAGLPAANFTDAAVAGAAIKAVHITELRSALDAARGALGLSTGGYTDTSVTGVAIKTVHVQELRDRVQ